MEKEETSFGSNKRKKDGLDAYCKVCANKAKKIYKTKNREKVAQNSKLYYNTNKKEISEKRQKRKYGISKQKMLEEQDNKCYICSRDFSMLNNNFICTDHNHSTGKVRKILCSDCNHSLEGNTKDHDVSIEILENSIKYLNKLDTIYRHYVSWKYRKCNEQSYKNLINNCNNKCEICYLEFANKNKNTTPCIDHNPNTGMIRGILCDRCNIRLGNSRDNIDIIRSCIDYLNMHNVNESVL